MILIIDNYDSFTYNLYQYIGEFNRNIEVYRNDQITIQEIQKKAPSYIVISPGPGYPQDAGISVKVVTNLGDKIPILGICLGHQSIVQAYGGKITHAKELIHGKTSLVEIDNTNEIFLNLDRNIKVGRYHSLIAESNNIPNVLEIIGRTDDSEIMAVKHKDYSVYGIQFHPESILTPDGKTIIKNFLSVS